MAMLSRMRQVDMLTMNSGMGWSFPRLRLRSVHPSRPVKVNPWTTRLHRRWRRKIRPSQCQGRSKVYRCPPCILHRPQAARSSSWVWDLGGRAANGDSVACLDMATSTTYCRRWTKTTSRRLCPLLRSSVHNLQVPTAVRCQRSRLLRTL